MLSLCLLINANSIFILVRKRQEFLLSLLLINIDCLVVLVNVKNQEKKKSK